MIEIGNERIAIDFIRGGSDCILGIPHKPGQSESYDRGYSVQYQHEQNTSMLTLGCKRGRDGHKKII